MTCNDCIHNDVCEALEMNGLAKVHPKQCGFHTDRSRYVELPIEVGATVYEIVPLYYSAWGEDDHKCYKCDHFYVGGMGDPSDCDLGKKCCYQICEKEASLRNIIDWITPSDFTKEVRWGKTVFLTKEDAEKALAERK